MGNITFLKRKREHPVESAHRVKHLKQEPSCSRISGSNAMEQQNSKPAGAVPNSTVTVDAVHPRLLDKSKQPQKSNCLLVPSNEVAYCVQCNEGIGHTVAALRNHFGSSQHESQPCVYCHGPVYNYILRSQKYYHECVSEATHGEQSSDMSNVSEEEGSDTSEKQSITSTKDAETTSLFCAHNTDSHNVSDMPSDEVT